MRGFTALALIVLSGCAAGGGGGGGGGGEADPFPDVQVGNNPELDANLAATADATAQALVCLGDERDPEELRPDEASVLTVLKREYNEDSSAAPTLPDFIAQTAQLEQARADEICDTTLDNASAELLDLIARLTAAGNRADQCQGRAPDQSDETSLQFIKARYLTESVHDYATMAESATFFVDEVERAVDQACAD